LRTKGYEKIGAVGYVLGFAPRFLESSGSLLSQDTALAAQSPFAWLQHRRSWIPSSYAIRGDVRSSRSKQSRCQHAGSALKVHLPFPVCSTTCRLTSCLPSEDMSFTPELRKQSEKAFADRKGKADYVDYEFKDHKGKWLYSSFCP